MPNSQPLMQYGAAQELRFELEAERRRRLGFEKRAVDALAEAQRAIRELVQYEMSKQHEPPALADLIALYSRK